MGLLPHSSPTNVYASEHYKADIARYGERLGINDVEFKSLLPSLFLPSYLKKTHNYRTEARVSMPVLNPHTPLNRDFDHYELMPTHNDMMAMVQTLRFSDDRPTFHLLNVGETHYPYALPHEDSSDWPRLPGLHGVVRQLDDTNSHDNEIRHFDQGQLDALRRRQVAAVDYLDTVFARLFQVVPRNTWIVVTSDHGELFGEDGYFGHGPIAHDKVLEVPFVEGPVP
jgi:hypothetical protein